MNLFQNTRDLKVASMSCWSLILGAGSGRVRGETGRTLGLRWEVGQSWGVGVKERHEEGKEKRKGKQENKAGQEADDFTLTKV